MNDSSKKRWIEVEALVRSTLDQPPGLREEFLSKACGGDEALRQEVQSFLDSHEDSDGFLEVPALTVAAKTLAAEKKSLAGTLMGPYQIVKLIGAGGMGEVYLAQDTRLRRQIALKVLPSEFAVNPVRVQRFEQEARAAGILNHPNILVIYDAGVHQGIPYIAAEYLQGETLRDRLKQGPLPLPKALDFAVQIARGLATAHEHNIIHRDLKPENIFITTEGRVKILDFGIAKLVESSAFPHETMTAPGVVIGTVGYLSPEQVRGYDAGLSSDIFAFGCVLYEMLTGQRAFLKDSNAETMTAIVREEPPTSDKLAILPTPLVRTLQRCLEKSPAERFHSARDLAFTLEAFCLPPQAGAAKPVKSPFRVGWLLAAVLGIATLALTSLLLTRKSTPAPLLRFEIAVPGDPVTGSPAVAISPDGKYVAFMAMGSNGKPVLWTRAMDSIDPRPVAGSEDARYPFWSGDSRFLAFQVGDKLKTLEIANSVQRTLCTIRGILNGAWNTEGVIIAGTGNGPILRIPPDGERFVPITSVNTAAGERSHWWPWFLPDNRHFLYTANASALEKSGVFVGSIDGKESKLLVKGVISNASFVAGYLLYSREGNLLARPFNASQLQVTGPEFSVVEKLKAYYGYTAYSVSQTGTLVFRSGDQGRYQLVWFDRTGKRLGPVEQNSERKWSEGILALSPALSPDGTQLATVQYQPSNGAYGIWISALTRANLEFPVTDTRNAESAVWSPDGTRIAYSASPSGGARDLFVKRLDEGGNGKLIYHSATDKWPVDWSSDGHTLLFSMNDAQAHPSLWICPTNESTVQPTAVPGAPPDVTQARFSPNVRWLAYASEHSGSSIVYVQDFPNGTMRVPISGKSATNPQWSHSGHELFYLTLQDELMSVAIEENDDGGLAAGMPKLLFKTASIGVNPYAVTPDGQRFLLQLPTEDTAVPVIKVVVNRFSEGPQ